MDMCSHGTITTGVDTLRVRVEHNMARGASKFCSKWKLADTGNNELYGWVILLIWRVWELFLVLKKKSNGTKIMDVFTKFMQCLKFQNKNILIFIKWKH